MPSSHSIDKPPTSTSLIAGKYQLVRMIGRGGMGSVWEAKHATLNTRVAVKFIETDSASSAEARVRFDNEAKAAATITSKHAIQIFDHGVTDDGHPYIVMEMLDGETLDHRIEARGRLSLQETAKILLQVCRGLNRAHERGIVHRDLKPENIFLVRGEDDDEEIAKVLDFGIAKIRSGEDGVGLGLSSGTKTGAVLGTPYFMSPEQARGLKEVDHRTDIWSLGVIAYKCVIGELPFIGQAVGDLLVKICTSPIPVPSHANPELPPAFDMWFARALDRDQDQRFSTVTELAEGLAYAAGLGTRAPRLTPASGLQGPGHTQPIHPTGSGPVHAGSAPPPSGSPATLADNPGVTSAPFTTSMHTPGLPQRRPALGIALGVLTLVAVGIGVFAWVAQHKDAQDAASRENQARHQGTSIAASTDPTQDGSALAEGAADGGSVKIALVAAGAADATDAGLPNLPVGMLAPSAPVTHPVRPGAGSTGPARNGRTPPPPQSPSFTTNPQKPGKSTADQAGY